MTHNNNSDELNKYLNLVNQNSSTHQWVDFREKISEIDSYIFNLNVRSINKNHQSLVEHLSASKLTPIVISLQEIWKVHDHKLISIEGYEFIRNNEVTSFRAGGLGYYIRKDIKYRILQNYSKRVVRSYEILTIAITVNEVQYTVLNIYRNPAQTAAQCNDFYSCLNDFLVQIDSSNDSEIIVMGDFNIDFCTKEGEKLINVLKETQLFPNVRDITRDSSNPKIIDNIFSSNFSNHMCVPRWTISDHFPIIMSLKQRIIESDQFIEKRDFDVERVEAFLQALKDTDWSPVYRSTNVEEMFEVFFLLYDNMFEVAFPLEKHKVKKIMIRSPWLTPGLLTSMKKEQKLYKAYIKSKSNVAKEIHSKFKKKLTKLKRIASQNYWKGKIWEASSNPKSIWSTIKKLKGESLDSVSKIELKIRDELVTDQTRIAEEFNNFFANIGVNLAKNFTYSENYKKYLTQANSSFRFQSIDKDELLAIIKQLKPKSSFGLDNIPTKIMIKSLKAIPDVSVHLINKVLGDGIFPQRLKYSVIKPLFKSGDSDDINNYRPISIVNSYSKIFEKVMATQIAEYLEKNKLFCESQYGFRKNRSTNQTILTLVDTVLEEKNSKKYSMDVYCDIRKAFDTLQPSILLEKLKAMGFDAIACKLVKSYFSNRVIFTKVGGRVSPTSCVQEVGVPQGSVLGPLFFLAYINDLRKAIPLDSKILLFADDTSVHISSDNLKDLEIKANSVLEKAGNWFKDNQLTLNAKKTKFILYNNNTPLKINFQGEPLEQIGGGFKTKSYRYLGFLVDSKLSFNDHVDMICRKIRNNVYFLNRIKRKVTHKARLLIYNGFINSHLQYGSVILSYSTKKNIDKLRKLQKKAIRSVYLKKSNHPTEGLFKKGRIMNLDQIHHISRIKLLADARDMTLPKDLRWMFSIDDRITRRNIDNHNFKINNVNVNNYLRYDLPKLWNDMDNIKKEYSKQMLIDDFKTELFGPKPHPLHVDEAYFRPPNDVQISFSELPGFC